MLNFPPVGPASTKINTSKNPVTRRIAAATATGSRMQHNLVDRRRMKDRRRRGAKQLIDRRLIADRRRSTIDLTV